MDVLKRILRKFVKGSGKEGSPRLPAFRGATLGKFLDVFHFIGRFFTAGSDARGKCPGRSGRHMVIPAAPRARRISARSVMVSQISALPR